MYDWDTLRWYESQSRWRTDWSDWATEWKLQIGVVLLCHMSGCSEDQSPSVLLSGCVLSCFCSGEFPLIWLGWMWANHILFYVDIHSPAISPFRVSCQRPVSPPQAKIQRHTPHSYKEEYYDLGEMLRRTKEVKKWGNKK